MRHHIFEDSERYSVAILIKSSSFSKDSLLTNYVQPLSSSIPVSDVIAFTLEYGENKKPSAKLMREYLEETLLPVLKELEVKHLYVADTTYFKFLTKKSNADPHLGYAVSCVIPGHEDMKVYLGINYQALIFNPSLQAKLDLSLKALMDSHQGTYKALGNDIIHSASYPALLQSKEAIEALHQYPALVVDLETFSLKFDKAGIGTIAFAWDQHNGIAITCDYSPNPDATNHPYGSQAPNYLIKNWLLDFFNNYKGKLIFHNASFDIKVLIYNLWMQYPLDTVGLLKGLEILTRDFEDTKIIAYLATNSTAGNELSLKSLAHSFAGNWAHFEIKDIRNIQLPELLKYNLIDTLSTWYTYNTYFPVMVADNQEDLYQTLMKDSLKLIIQMELTGMPMDSNQIQKVKVKLEETEATALKAIQASPYINEVNQIIRHEAMVTANAKLKTKQHPIEKYSHLVFNPGSNKHMQILLFDCLKLPVLDFTPTKQPAVGVDTLKKLVNHTTDPEQIALLQSIIDYGQVVKILSTFIPAFEEGIDKEDGAKYLHGNFNLGGTVSGRLSSSEPNLQNLPANSAYGEAVKTCFKAPNDWLFVGADFNSLEDYISALTTKDPQKLKVYIDGYDGHCLRAFAYFKDQLPDIENTVESINSIQSKYPKLRQDSKGPTFALTYQGTWITLVKNLGFTEEQAKSIEANYHELYKVSDQYVQDRLSQAAQDGYVDVAFGLRVRTPLLKQVVYGGAKSPYEAAAEGRTAGNALGQSYGLLNNRAATEFMKKVWASEYRYDIKPVSLIHDAIYLLVRDDIDVVHWVNQELIKSMQWQELPEIQHDIVKIGAALDIFWPDWSNPITLPNEASKETIINICKTTKEHYEQSNHASH